MSRRKQAKPRAFKREDLLLPSSLDEEGESSEDTLFLQDIRMDGPDSADDQTWLAEDATDPAPSCDECKMQFDTLTELLDHVHQDCVNGGSTGGGGSVRSSDTPDDLSSPGGCPTPSSSSGDPPPPSDSEVAFTVGVTESTPYGCQFCDKAFPRLTYLKRHEQIHSDQMPFRCDYCHRLFKHKRSRDRHVKLHTGDRKYRCTQCESAFSRSDHLKIHMRTHDNGKPYQCAVCNRGYNTAAALSSHMQNHKKAGTAATAANNNEDCATADSDTLDPPKPLLCNLCPHACSSPTALGEHVIQAHRSSSSPLCESPGSRPCSKCAEELASLGAACPHGKQGYSEAECEKSNQESPSPKPDRCSPGSKLTCGFCAQSDFPTFESLQLHVQVLHLATGGATLAASVRSLMHKRPQNSLTDPWGPFADCDSSSFHFLLKHRPHDTYCSQCNVGFASSAALLDHVHRVHESGQTNNNHATKRSVSSSRSRPNGAKHLKPSSLMAPVFNGATSSHFRRQDPGGGGQQTPFSSGPSLLCSQCNAGFSDFESFRSHLKSHLDAASAPAQCQSERRAFSCPECGAEMSSESQLDSHVSGHYLSSSTEYGCQSCLKLFSRPDELQKHLMDVHACHLYRCALCKQMFDSKVSIQVHFAVKHSNECRSLKCTSCSAYFRTEIEFQVHVKLAHLSSKNGFRCLLCDRLFPSEAQLQFHAAQHERQFPCAACGEAFHVEFLLERHVQSAHGGGREASPGPPQEAQNLCTKKTSGGQTNRDPPTPADTPPAASPVGSPPHKDQGSKGSGVSLFCAYCNESCKSRRELEHHMKSHASPSRHKCNICDEICPSAATLAEHKLTHCKVVSGSTCVVCRVHLLTEDQFLGHVGQHGGPGLPAPCVVCRQTLVAEVEARTHARYHLTRADGHPCCVCSRMFDPGHLVPRGSASGTTTYMCKECFHQHSAEQNKCPDCGVKFETPQEMDVHRRAQHPRQEYEEGTHLECRLCHEVVDSSSRLQCHLIEHTYEGSSHFTCYLCASVFTGSHLLQRHMLEHGLDSRPYDCADCGEKFFFRAELDNHSVAHAWKNLVHSTNNAAARKRSSRQEDLYHFDEDSQEQPRNRLGIRENNRSYECPFCGKRFPRKEARRLHMKSHHNRGSYTCSHCDKVFLKRSQLKEHVRTHVTAASTTHACCEICEATLPSFPDLRRHLRDAHNRRYDHACVVCGELFDDEGSLLEHQGDRHRVRPESPPPPPPAAVHRRSSSNDAESSDTLIEASSELVATETEQTTDATEHQQEEVAT